MVSGSLTSDLKLLLEDLHQKKTSVYRSIPYSRLASNRDAHCYRKARPHLMAFTVRTNPSYTYSVQALLGKRFRSFHLLGRSQQSCFLWSKTVFKKNCYNFKCDYVLNCNLFLCFQHHYSSLQCHMIFRNHNNMLIIINVVPHNTLFWYIVFFRIHRCINSSKEQRLLDIESFVTL